MSNLITKLFFFIAAVTRCFALLDGKHTDAYRAIIRALKGEADRRGTMFQIQFVMSDFEGELMEAIKAEVSFWFSCNLLHIIIYV